MEAKRWPVREEHHLLTVHTYCESSKSSEGVTVVAIGCDDATFECHSRRSTPVHN